MNSLFIIKEVSDSWAFSFINAKSEMKIIADFVDEFMISEIKDQSHLR